MAKDPFTGEKTVDGPLKFLSKVERVSHSTAKRERRFKKSSRQLCTNSRKACSSLDLSKKLDRSSRTGWRMSINRVFVREPMSDTKKSYGFIWSQKSGIISFKSFHRSIFSPFTKETGGRPFGYNRY